MCRLFDLSQKNVINIEDGASLGKISDLELDEQSGRVLYLIIPGKMRAMGLLGKSAEIVIPWDFINRIGNDVILVRLSSEQSKKYTK